MSNVQGENASNSSYIPEDIEKEYDGSVYQVEEVIYDENEDDEININNVEGEIEVDSHQEEWMIPMGQPSTSRQPIPTQKTPLTPRIVLKTIDDLRVRPRVHVSCGKRPIKPIGDHSDRDNEEYPEEPEAEEPETMGIPPIRAALRMYANAAIRNAGNVRLLDIDGELVNCPIDEDAREDAPRIGKRGQTIFSHKNWPLYNDRAIDFQEACEILCGAIEVDKKQICTSIPQSFKNEGTFIVDLRMMRNRHDVHLDGLGSWGKPTGRVRYYSKEKEGSNRILRADDGKGKINRGVKYVWKCMLKRYEHPVTSMINNGANRYIKKIYTALYPTEVNKAVGLAVVSYEWLGREPFDFPVNNTTRPVHRRPHGAAPPGGSWEAASFQNRHHGALPATMSGFFGDIPIYAVGAVDFHTAASIILGGIAVDPTNVPQGYRDAGTFVIDTEYLAADGLLRRDDNGIWGKPAGTSRYYIIEANSGDAIRIDNNNKLPPGSAHDIQILCKRYEHPSVDRRFVRKIYTAKTTGITPLPHRITLAVISYFWKGEPAPIEVKRQNHVSAAQQDYIEEDFAAYTDRPGPSSEVKRRRTDSQMQSDGQPDEEDEMEFKRALWKKEYENQVRFSSLLDRAEAFIGRLERATGNVLYTQENGVNHQEWNQRTETAEEPTSEANEEEFPG